MQSQRTISLQSIAALALHLSEKCLERLPCHRKRTQIWINYSYTSYLHKVGTMLISIPRLVTSRFLLNLWLIQTPVNRKLWQKHTMHIPWLESLEYPNNNLTNNKISSFDFRLQFRLYPLESIGCTQTWCYIISYIISSSDNFLQKKG